MPLSIPVMGEKGVFRPERPILRSDPMCHYLLSNIPSGYRRSMSRESERAKRLVGNAHAKTSSPESNEISVPG